MKQSDMVELISSLLVIAIPVFDLCLCFFFLFFFHPVEYFMYYIHGLALIV